MPGVAILVLVDIPFGDLDGDQLCKLAEKVAILVLVDIPFGASQQGFTTKAY